MTTDAWATPPSIRAAPTSEHPSQRRQKRPTRERRRAAPPRHRRALSVSEGCWNHIAVSRRSQPTRQHERGVPTESGSSPRTGPNIATRDVVDAASSATYGESRQDRPHLLQDNAQWLDDHPCRRPHSPTCVSPYECPLHVTDDNGPGPRTCSPNTLSVQERASGSTAAPVPAGVLQHGVLHCACVDLTAIPTQPRRESERPGGRMTTRNAEEDAAANQEPPSEISGRAVQNAGYGSPEEYPWWRPEGRCAGQPAGPRKSTAPIRHFDD